MPRKMDFLLARLSPLKWVFLVLSWQSDSNWIISQAASLGAVFLQQRSLSVVSFPVNWSFLIMLTTLFSVKCGNYSVLFKDAEDVSLDVACSVEDSLSILMTDSPLENLGVWSWVPYLRDKSKMLPLFQKF